MRVLIVGGGIAGLSLAIALEPTGADVEVIEREREWTTEGAAITLRPLAVRAIRRLGVLDDVLAAGRVVDRQQYFNLIGDMVGEQMLADEGEMTVVIHRQKLQRLLSDRLGRAAVRMGEHPVAVETGDSVVDVILSGGERRRFDLVIGADGIHSWLRRELFPGATVEPVGQQYWRFCVEGELIEHWCAVRRRTVSWLFCRSGDDLLCRAACRASAVGRQRRQPDTGAIPDLRALPVTSFRRSRPGHTCHRDPLRSQPHEVILKRWSSGPIGLIGDAAHGFRRS